MGVMEILMLMGGLAMFLYGMNVMGDSLEKLGGGKLERILEKLTSNPIKGVIMGTIVTAIIQSSSATTVMVVGFVNSGIMKLYQSIGIIMGANIGTTITAWMLSMSVIDGDSLFIQLLKPVNFTPILAIIGIGITMFSKSSKKKNIAFILLGFAILMFGMDKMSTAVEGLKNNDNFTKILVMFENPVLGVLAGAFITAIIQSSSASIGILQALSMTGAISFGAAIPIILGQNIGTCATALIASVGVSKDAKRAAVVHLYFNIIGSVLFLIAFYAINSIVGFGFMEDSVNPLNIAVFNTFFKVLTTVIFLPFTRLLEKLAKLTIKDGKETNMFAVLDDKFFQNPQYALDQSTVLTTNMAFIAKETYEYAIESMSRLTEKIDKCIMDNETSLDEYEDALNKYLVRLSARVEDNHQSRHLTLLLHAISEFERITDYEADILHTSRSKSGKNYQFSDKAIKELDILCKAVSLIMDLAIKSFREDDIESAARIEPLYDVVENIGNELRSRHIGRMRDGKCTVETGVIFTDYITSLEKISHHCKNIGAFVMQKNDATYEMHSDAHTLRRNSETYKAVYNDFKSEYLLPASNSVAEL